MTKNRESLDFKPEIQTQPEVFGSVKLVRHASIVYSKGPFGPNHKLQFC